MYYHGYTFSDRSGRYYYKNASICYVYIPPLASKGFGGPSLYGLIAGLITIGIVLLILVVIILRRHFRKQTPPPPMPINRKMSNEQFDQANYDEIPNKVKRPKRHSSEIYSDANRFDESTYEDTENTGRSTNDSTYDSTYDTYADGVDHKGVRLSIVILLLHK